MRPVLAGLCRYESLKDGALSLADIALLNDALSVKRDNESLVEHYMQRKQ